MGCLFASEYTSTLEMSGPADFPCHVYKIFWVFTRHLQIASEGVISSRLEAKTIVKEKKIK